MKKILHLTFFAVLSIVMIYLSNKPKHNWDMIPYMGVVIGMDISDKKQVHQETYKRLKNETSNDEYNQLTTISDYRLTMANNYKAFNENLSYYSIKKLYTNWIRLFYKSGVSLSYSTVLPSIFSITFMILFIYFILYKELKNIYLSLIIVSIILSLGQLTEIATLSTPDALSSFLLLLIAFSFLYKRHNAIILLLMVLSVLTRTDNIIWCSFLIVSDFISNYRLQKLISNGIALIILLIVYLGLNSTANNGGWWVVFYNTFIDRVNYPLTETPNFEFLDYLKTIIKRSYLFINGFLIILMFLYLHRYSILNMKLTRELVIIMVCIFTFIARFSLFPVNWDRFNFILLLIPILIIIIENKQFLTSYKKH